MEFHGIFHEIPWNFPRISTEFHRISWNWGWWNSMEFREFTEFDGIRFRQGYPSIECSARTLAPWSVHTATVKENSFLKFFYIALTSPLGNNTAVCHSVTMLNYDCVIMGLTALEVVPAEDRTKVAGMPTPLWPLG
jgi:hypothetical protein